MEPDKPEPVAVKPVEPEPVEEPEAVEEDSFDYSSVDPKKWECWATCDLTNQECKGCPYNTECAAEMNA